MYYPKLQDPITNSFTPSKFLYVAGTDKVIYKISNTNSCNDKCGSVIAVDKELLNAEGNCIKITYSKTDTSDEETDVVKYIYLDYLIVDGDKYNNKTHEIDPNEECGGTEDATTLANKFKNLIYESFITDVLNGKSLSSAYSQLPNYVKFNGSAKDVDDSPSSTNKYITSVVPDMYISDSTESNSELYKRLKAKAEKDCLTVANNIMNKIEKEVQSVTLTIN